jgi:putative peptide zinc metalloprotease protein
MIIELFVAACAAIVWANTGPGVLHSLGYDMIFVASVSTIVFNINPLLRYDGYYILSDILDIPNLHAQAMTHLRHLVERYAFGYAKSRSPASSRKEAFWLTVFGVLSMLYRFVVFGGILLFLANRFLLAGIVMAFVCGISWVLAPALRFVRYLSTDSRLEQTRLRAALSTAGAAALVIALLALVPLPSSFKSPGVLKARNEGIVVNRVAGVVSEILVSSGARVHPGEPLLRMENGELVLRIQELEGKLAEVESVRQRDLQQSVADLKPVESLIDSIRQQLQRLQEDRDSLVVSAPMEGVWVAPREEELVGAWVRRGTPVGQVVDDRSFYFSSVVSQRNVARVFSGEIRGADVRLTGQSDLTIPVVSTVRIPVESTLLPSAALGVGAGGEILVSPTDPSGTRAAQSFYEVRLQLAEAPAATLFHGQSGRVRFRLPPEPLLQQELRSLRQLVQERYRQ